MYLIKDPVDDSQRFPLTAFLEHVLNAVGAGDASRNWRVFCSWGYGKDVCALEDLLEERESIQIQPSDLLRISKDTGQWFYDLHCVDEQAFLRFGVLDSSALYLDGNEDLCKRIADCFDQVSQTSSSPP